MVRATSGFVHATPRRDLEILDRVGGGDSFVAGLAYGLLDGHGPERRGRMGRRARRARDDDAGRHVDGDARRGRARSSAAPARASGADARVSASCRSAAHSSATSTASSPTRTRARPSTPRGTSAIRYFDTAPHYGLGLSERRLGAALADAPARRVRALDEGRPAARAASPPSTGWTTAGSSSRRRTAAGWDFSRDGIRRSLAESLERLGLDRVDIVYLHDPDDHWDEVRRRPASPRSPSCAPKASSAPIGAGMNQSAMLADLVRHADVDVLMLAGPLHAPRAGQPRRPPPALRGARRRRRRGRRLQQRAARAVRARRATRGTTTATRRRELVERARAIAAVCERHGTTLPAAAIAFPLAHPAVVSVCVGARSAEQIEQNAELFRRADPGRSVERAEGGGASARGRADE